MRPILDATVISNGRLLARVRLDKPEIHLGRDPRVDLYLNDRRISRVHAILHRHDDGFELIDQGSSNGTKLNGNKFAIGELVTGDVIELGRFEIHVEIRFRENEEPEVELEVLGDDPALMRALYGSKTTIRID